MTIKHTYKDISRVLGVSIIEEEFGTLIGLKTGAGEFYLTRQEACRLAEALTGAVHQVRDKLVAEALEKR